MFCDWGHAQRQEMANVDDELFESGSSNYYETEWNSHEEYAYEVNSTNLQCNEPSTKRARSEGKDNIVVPSLLEMATERVAASYSFETVEHFHHQFQPVPLDIQLDIMKRSFPCDENLILTSVFLSRRSVSFNVCLQELLREADNDKLIVQDAMQIGFSLTASVVHKPIRQSKRVRKASVVIECDRQRITSATCSVHRKRQLWCQHVVRLAFHRIRQPSAVAYRLPVSYSLQQLDANQHKQLIHTLLSEHPVECLSNIQKVLDVLTTSDGNHEPAEMIRDLTAGAGVGDEAVWHIDAAQIRKVVKDFCGFMHLERGGRTCTSEDREDSTRNRTRTLTRLSNQAVPVEQDEIDEQDWYDLSELGTLLQIVRRLLKRGEETAVKLLQLLTEQWLCMLEAVVKTNATTVFDIDSTKTESSLYRNIELFSCTKCCCLPDRLIAYWRLAVLSPHYDQRVISQLQELHKSWGDRLNQVVVAADVEARRLRSVSFGFYDMDHHNVKLKELDVICSLCHWNGFRHVQVWASTTVRNVFEKLTNSHQGGSNSAGDVSVCSEDSAYVKSTLTAVACLVRSLTFFGHVGAAVELAVEVVEWAFEGVFRLKESPLPLSTRMKSVHLLSDCQLYLWGGSDALAEMGLNVVITLLMEVIFRDKELWKRPADIPKYSDSCMFNLSNETGEVSSVPPVPLPLYLFVMYAAIQDDDTYSRCRSSLKSHAEASLSSKYQSLAFSQQPHLCQDVQPSGLGGQSLCLELGPPTIPGESPSLQAMPSPTSDHMSVLGHPPGSQGEPRSTIPVKSSSQGMPRLGASRRLCSDLDVSQISDAVISPGSSKRQEVEPIVDMNFLCVTDLCEQNKSSLQQLEQQQQRDQQALPTPALISSFFFESLTPALILSDTQLLHGPSAASLQLIGDVQPRDTAMQSSQSQQSQQHTLPIPVSSLQSISQSSVLSIPVYPSVQQYPRDHQLPMRSSRLFFHKNESSQLNVYSVQRNKLITSVIEFVGSLDIPHVNAWLVTASRALFVNTPTEKVNFGRLLHLLLGVFANSLNFSGSWGLLLSQIVIGMKQHAEVLSELIVSEGCEDAVQYTMTEHAALLLLSLQCCKDSEDDAMTIIQQSLDPLSSLIPPNGSLSHLNEATRCKQLSSFMTDVSCVIHLMLGKDHFGVCHLIGQFELLHLPILCNHSQESSQKPKWKVTARLLLKLLSLCTRASVGESVEEPRCRLLRILPGVARELGGEDLCKLLCSVGWESCLSSSDLLQQLILNNHFIRNLKSEVSKSGIVPVAFRSILMASATAVGTLVESQGFLAAARRFGRETELFVIQTVANSLSEHRNPEWSYVWLFCISSSSVGTAEQRLNIAVAAYRSLSVSVAASDGNLVKFVESQFLEWRRLSDFLRGLVSLAVQVDKSESSPGSAVEKILLLLRDTWIDPQISFHVVAEAAGDVLAEGSWPEPSKAATGIHEQISREVIERCGKEFFDVITGRCAHGAPDGSFCRRRPISTDLVCLDIILTVRPDLVSVNMRDVVRMCKEYWKGHGDEIVGEYERKHHLIFFGNDWVMDGSD